MTCILSQLEFAWGPIHLACADGSLQAVEALLDTSADVDESTRGDAFCPVHLAARFGQNVIIRKLAMASCRIDSLDAQGNSALHYAAAFGHSDCCKVLCEFGADATLPERSGRRASDLATEAGHSSVAAQLKLFEAQRGAQPRLLDWLNRIGLQEHFIGLLKQGFDDIDFIARVGLSDTDLDAIGVQLAGHRKKLSTLYLVEGYVNGASAPSANTGEAGGPEDKPQLEDGDSGDEDEDDEDGSGSGSGSGSDEEDEDEDEDDSD